LTNCPLIFLWLFSAGIVHRDVKAGNVLLAPGAGQVRFLWARCLEAQSLPLHSRLWIKASVVASDAHLAKHSSC